VRPTISAWLAFANTRKEALAIRAANRERAFGELNPDAPNVPIGDELDGVSQDKKAQAETTQAQAVVYAEWDFRFDTLPVGMRVQGDSAMRKQKDRSTCLVCQPGCVLTLVPSEVSKSKSSWDKELGTYTLVQAKHDIPSYNCTLSPV
jgi:hypothetical protein